MSLRDEHAQPDDGPRLKAAAQRWMAASRDERQAFAASVRASARTADLTDAEVVALLDMIESVLCVFRTDL